MGNSLNLKKLFVVEIAIIIVAIVTVAVFVEISPFLGASNQTGQIGVYNQRTVRSRYGDSCAGSKSKFNV